MLLWTAGSPYLGISAVRLVCWQLWLWHHSAECELQIRTPYLGISAVRLVCWELWHQSWVKLVMSEQTGVLKVVTSELSVSLWCQNKLVCRESEQTGVLRVVTSELSEACDVRTDWCVESCDIRACDVRSVTDWRTNGRTNFPWCHSYMRPAVTIKTA